MIEQERKYKLSKQEYEEAKKWFPKGSYHEYTKEYYAHDKSKLRINREDNQFTFKHRIDEENRIEIESKSLKEIEQGVVDQRSMKIYEEFQICVGKFFESKMTDHIHTKRYIVKNYGMVITLDCFSNGRVTLYEIEFELDTATEFNEEAISDMVNVDNIIKYDKLTRLHKEI